MYTQQKVADTVNSADTLIIRTAAKSKARINYRRLTEINSRYCGLFLLMKRLSRGPTVSAIKRVDCTHRRDKYTCTGAV